MGVKASLGTLWAALVVVLLAMHWQCPELPEQPDASLRTAGGSWDGSVRDRLQEHGYAHIVGLLNRSEVDALRSLAHQYCYGETRRALPLSWGGYSIPGFLDLPDFVEARWLLDDRRVHDVLRAAFGGAHFRFASHNDIGCDFVGVWHKDILRGPHRKYQTSDIWAPDGTGEVYGIYKLMFYLQDHDHDSRALKVVPGSHRSRDISLQGGFTALHPRMGDAVIFDQRVSHAGNTFYDVFGPGRLFLQLGFGRANRFTDEFERGTVDRQEASQRKMLSVAQQRGWRTVLTDARFFATGLVFSALPPQLLNMLADIDVAQYPMLGHLIFSNTAKPRS